MHAMSRDGMYHPFFEHDACGIGFVVNVKGTSSHTIVRQGIQVLENLVHRGACGCDPETGDGAGMLVRLPHRFFQEQSAKLKFDLPDFGDYGVGMLFLPKADAARKTCKEIIE
ncbi:MAG: hypothetical protein U9Q79_11595, partial [Candidatus Hydrogenedentes bacterium]|nr:hypothetical protein [Candidatus Hydrogenedentota bacterium]